MNVFVDLRTATDHFPGIGRYAVNLIRALESQIGDLGKLHLIADSLRSSRWNLAAFDHKNGNFIRIEASPFSIRQQWVVPLVLKKQKADLYHSLYYIMPFFSRVPTVLTIYDLIPLIFPDYFPLHIRLLYRLANYWALVRSQHIISISRSTAQDLIDRYSIPEKRVTAIHLAADDSFYPRENDEIESVLKRLKLPKNYILYVGSNKPHKNLTRLIKAWEKISTPKPALVIAGFWDPRYPEAKDYVKSKHYQKFVYFVGPVADADLPALYTGAKLFAYPSKYEGFGLPVLEAMACGTAVVTTNISSLCEVTGDAAILVDPLSVDELSCAIRSLLEDEDLLRHHEKLGITRAKRFTWQKCASETIEVYKQIYTAS
jgi:alpha-1,3-rhamnosyl/mannosyltransferase